MWSINGKFTRHIAQHSQNPSALCVIMVSELYLCDGTNVCFAPGKSFYTAVHKHSACARQHFISYSASHFIQWGPSCCSLDHWSVGHVLNLLVCCAVASLFVTVTHGYCCLNVTYMHNQSPHAHCFSRPLLLYEVLQHRLVFKSSCIWVCLYTLCVFSSCVHEFACLCVTHAHVLHCCFGGGGIKDWRLVMAT